MNKISIMKPLLVSAMLLLAVTGKAQSHGNRLSLGVGALYERGFDVTLAVEHETKNHNAWEYFANGYIKWAKDESAGHVTKEAFWNNYRTWGLGMPISHVWYVPGTSMVVCVSEPVLAVIPMRL